MTNYVAVFKSKTQLMIFLQTMRFYGAIVTTTPTPTKAMIGCGISASFDLHHLDLAKQVIYEKGLDSFHAIYKVTKDGLRTSTLKIL